MSGYAKDNPQLELVQLVMDETARLLIDNLPYLQQFSAELLDTVFVPRVVARQLVLAIALESGILTYKQVKAVVVSLTSHFSSRRRLIAQLKRKQEEAQTQDDWMTIAEAIDLAQGHTGWRSDPNCALYEKERITARIDEFVHLMRRRDIFELMFILRGGIARNKFGLLHEGLFSKALAGTKVLVETYHNVVCAALDFVCDAPVKEGESPIPTDVRLSFFNETRHAFGRTALILSGGAALGFYHAGVVKALMDNNLMPRVIGGSSAGSILCSMIGTRTDEECRRDLYNVKGTVAPGHHGELMLDFFRSVRPQPNSAHAGKGIRHDIEEVLVNSAGAFKDGKRTWQLFIPIGLRGFTSLIYDLITGSRRPSDLLKSDTAHLRRCCRTNIGDFSFQEAFDRTGRILNIVITPTTKGDPPRVLNYLTSPHVLVWSAAVASSSLPGVFEANRLMVKDVDGTERYESATEMKFSDGSMEQDLPMQQLSECFNVNHFIISQANPHAVCFGAYNVERSVWAHPVTGVVHSVLVFLKDQLRAWLTHCVELLGGRRFSPLFGTQRDFGTQIFTQEYSGRDCDISFVPWMSHRNLFSAFLHCIYNPSQEEFISWMAAAERETWKYIPAIKSHIAEEVTLDRCVQRLRKRIALESWEKNRNVSAGKMANRDSFYTSPSLTCLGGLAVADQSVVESLGDKYHTELRGEDALSRPIKTESASLKIPSSDVNAGWDGLGIQGNRQVLGGSGTDRAPSQNSGLFIDDEEQHHLQKQHPAQTTAEPAKLSPVVADNKTVPSSSKPPDWNNMHYFKTTNMAGFYYRKGSHSNLRKSVSDHHMRKANPSEAIMGGKSDSAEGSPERRKSASHSDLALAARLVTNPS